MKVYHPPPLSNRSSYITDIPNAFNSTASTTSIDEDKEDADIGIKLVEAKLTYKSILNFSIDHHHNENEHYHHTIESHRRTSASLHTGVDSNVGTIATTGTDNMIKSDYSVVEVVLDTGRKHQIRTQLSHLGHPIYEDIKYGGRNYVHKGREVDSVTYNTLSSVQYITIAK
jgi:23S rRNA-/tRNA-specific pseudouridylate synthase